MDLNHLQLLQKGPLKLATEILHAIIDGLCGRCIPSYSSYSETWELEQWWQLTDSYKQLCMQYVKEKADKDKIKTKVEGLSEEYQKVVIEVLSLREDEIHQNLMAATSAVSHAHLKDFDWQLKLAMSSDKLASVQQGLLSVDLDVQCGDEHRVTSIELDKDDLFKMITTLESASKVVMQLKT